MKPNLLALTLLLPLVAQERVDTATDAKMRSEELEHSQLMHTLHMLTDVYGPRLAGSPEIKEAAGEARKTRRPVTSEISPSRPMAVRRTTSP